MVVVHSLSRVQLFATPGTAVCQDSVLHYLLEFAHTHVPWVDDAIQPSQPLSPASALNLSQHQRLFQQISPSHQYWSFSISPSN